MKPALFLLLALALIILTAAHPLRTSTGAAANPANEASPSLADTSLRQRRRRRPRIPRSSGGGDDEDEQADDEQEEDQSETDEALAEAEEDVNESFSCFPASAVVSLHGGNPRSMEDLAVGESVSVGDAESRVFMFTHADRDGQHPFVRLSTASGHALSLSAGHYLYANGALVRADSVQVGDALRLAAGGESAVVEVGATLERGLYNPQTLHGDIAVNGIVSSTYTAAVEPALAHALLAPARAAYDWFGLKSGLLRGGAPDIVRGFLPLGVSK